MIEKSEGNDSVKFDSKRWGYSYVNEDTGVNL